VYARMIQHPSTFHRGLRALRARPASLRRRTFISTPEQKLHISRTLPYSQKQLYDLVSDVNSYHQFLPFCTSSRIVSRPPTGAAAADAPYKVELTVEFMGIEQSYISDVYLIPNERVEAVASRDTPIFTKLRSVWAFAPCSSPSSQNHPHDASPARAECKESFTRFSLDLEFGFINPLHAALSAASMGRVSEKMAEAFVARCTQMYGPKDGLTR